MDEGGNYLPPVDSHQYNPIIADCYTNGILITFICKPLSQSDTIDDMPRVVWCFIVTSEELSHLEL